MNQSNKTQNLLQFNAEEIHHLNLSLKTKSNSLTFGRSLYTFEYDQQQYWLKTQALNVNPYYEAGFLNELAFYRQFLDQLNFPDFLLPFQIVSQLEKIDDLQEPNVEKLVLITKHANLLLNDCTHWSLQEIKQAVLMLLDAVEQLHQLGWIHGDLKHEHFVCEQKKVYLIDFEQSEKIHSATKLHTMTATPHYMAPELFHGLEKTVQTDIYALGIIIYEWLIGQRLTAKSYENWAYLHCQRLHIELPAHFLIFKPLLKGMLAKQKEQRFLSIYTAKQCLMPEIV